MSLESPICNHLWHMQPIKKADTVASAKFREETSKKAATLLRPPQDMPVLSAGDTLKVNGFISSVRKQKRVAFAAVSDGSTLDTLQAVLTPEQAEGFVDSPKPS